MKLRAFVFFTALLVFTGLAWLSGFNFDQRSFGVAYFSAVAVLFSAIAAFFPGLGD